MFRRRKKKEKPEKEEKKEKKPELKPWQHKYCDSLAEVVELFNQLEADGYIVDIIDIEGSRRRGGFNVIFHCKEK